jgi:hypothetical protein
MSKSIGFGSILFSRFSIIKIDRNQYQIIPIDRAKAALQNPMLFSLAQWMSKIKNPLYNVKSTIFWGISPAVFYLFDSLVRLPFKSLG